MKQKQAVQPTPVGLGDTFVKGDNVFIVVGAAKAGSDTFDILRKGDTKGSALPATLEKLTKNGYKHVVRVATPQGEVKSEAGNGEAKAKADAKQGTAMTVSPALVAIGKTVRDTPLPNALLSKAAKGVAAAVAAVLADSAVVVKSDDIKPDEKGHMPIDIATDLTMPIPAHRARTRDVLRVTFPNGKNGTLPKGRTGYVYVAHHDDKPDAQCLYFQPDGSTAERSPYPVWPQEVEIIADVPEVKARAATMVPPVITSKLGKATAKAAAKSKPRAAAGVVKKAAKKSKK